MVSDASGAMSRAPFMERTDHDFELVSINDLSDGQVERDAVPASTASTAVSPARSKSMATISMINGKRIHVTAERDPAKLPHKAPMASTSCSNAPASSPTSASCEKHLDAGAKRVLISAPARALTTDHRVRRQP
jgi:glyceraldehyde 3-phosphate dehydrogenase